MRYALCTTIKIMKHLKTLLLIIILPLSLRSKAQDNLNNSINAVTSTYFDIKNALVANDGNKAEAKAKEFIAALNKVTDKDMNPAQAAAWKTNINKLQYDSRHISETNDAEHQREHFAPLSQNFYAVLKAFKVNNSDIYEQYCPMKKVYWISETQVIKNPYYGTKMPDCGKTVQTLKAAKKG
jgi:hypothetical protein